MGEGANPPGLGNASPDSRNSPSPGMGLPAADSGHHVCLRAADVKAVEAFHGAALQAGGSCDGAPGLRPEYSGAYYAAFVRDPEGNRIEAVTFLKGPR